VDDGAAALFTHHRADRLGGMERGIGVAGEFEAPGLVIDIAERCRVTPADIVAEDIHAPECLDGLGDHSFDLLLVMCIGRHGEASAAGFSFDLGGSCFQHRDSASGNRDIAAVMRQQQRCRLADTGAAARDDGDAALQLISGGFHGHSFGCTGLPAKKSLSMSGSASKSSASFTRAILVVQAVAA
jgi:hypothetical protein